MESERYYYILGCYSLTTTIYGEYTPRLDVDRYCYQANRELASTCRSLVNGA